MIHDTHCTLEDKAKGKHKDKHKHKHKKDKKEKDKHKDKITKRPNMCYIFENGMTQGYQIR